MGIHSIRHTGVWGALLLGAACVGGPGAPPPSAGFSDQAIAFLDDLQPTSFEINRELCGYFGLDEFGRFVATEPETGALDYCDLPWQPDDFTVVATYHTHGAFTEDHDTEVPSPDDVRSDRRAKTYGYISTPGGRVWLVDWTTSVSTLLCTRCVARDPGYLVQPDDPTRRQYTLDDLIARDG